MHKTHQTSKLNAIGYSNNNNVSEISSVNAVYYAQNKELSDDNVYLKSHDTDNDYFNKLKYDDESNKFNLSFEEQRFGNNSFNKIEDQIFCNSLQNSIEKQNLDISLDDKMNSIENQEHNIGYLYSKMYKYGSKKMNNSYIRQEKLFYNKNLNNSHIDRNNFQEKKLHSYSFDDNFNPQYYNNISLEEKLSTNYYHNSNYDTKKILNSVPKLRDLESSISTSSHLEEDLKPSSESNNNVNDLLSVEEQQSTKYFNSMWTTIVDSKDDWRVVGARRRSNSVSEKNFSERRISDIHDEPPFGEAFYLTISKKFLNMNVSEIVMWLGEPLYLIEFYSGRLDIGYVTDKKHYDLGVYVIIEADRGEDCGQVVSITQKDKYHKLLARLKDVPNEVHPKRIFRAALKKDIHSMVSKKQAEEKALAACRKKVLEYGLSMEVLGCEYQWDMKKLTFFFVSKYRIDFRDLVRDLHQTYTVRIWMCAVEKSKNSHLRNLM